MDTRLRERLDRLSEDRPNGCRVWIGARDRNGYPVIRIGGRKGRTLYAHRVAYEEYVGPIPADRELDHVKDRGCVSRGCIAIAHLEPVTRAENNRRKRRERPPCGHEYDAIDAKSGLRRCRQCKNAYLREYRKRNQRKGH